jgi:hypothetical protein
MVAIRFLRNLRGDIILPRDSGGGKTSDLVLAMRPHPSFPHERQECCCLPIKRREAERRKAQHWSRILGCGARLAIGALAFRRSTAALASAMCRSSIQAALHAMQCAGVSLSLGIALKRSTSRAGRNAGGVDARTAREQK